MCITSVVEDWVYPSFCNIRTHTHTHKCKNNTHTSTHALWHTHRRKRGNSLSMRWTILDISWHIFTTHFPSLWQLPQFSLLALLTTRGCIWMKKDAHTHTHTHTCRRRGNEKRVVLQLERGRHMWYSFFCDATRTTQWTHTHTHTHTHIHTHTHGLMLSPSLIQSCVHDIVCITWAHFHDKKKTLVSSGTMRDLRGARWSMQARKALSLHAHTNTNTHTHTHTRWPTSPCVQLTGTAWFA